MNTRVDAHSSAREHRAGKQPRASAKIAHILARFKTYSGAEHFCFRWAREALRRGQRITIVTRHMDPDLTRHVPDGVELRVLRWAHEPTRFHFLESIFDVLYSPFLHLLVPDDSDCDVYWNDNTLAALFLDSLRRRKHRIFLCLQLPHFAYGQTKLVTRSYPPLSWLVPIFTPFYRWLDRRFAARADAIFAISEMVRNDCMRVYGRSDVALVSPGINLPDSGLLDRRFIRSVLGIQSRHILVTAGKVVPKKNFDVFVRVIDILRRRRCDVTGVVIGDGPMLGRIRNMIDRLHLEKHCRLTGFVPDYADVLRYMSGATIYVYLERDVPFGLTPLEASSLAVPVVAFEGGGVEETVIPGENGIKIPSSYGPDEIADLLHELLAAPEAERTRMGRRGQELARRWTWERSYDRFLEAADRSEAVDHSRRPSPCSPRDQ